MNGFVQQLHLGLARIYLPTIPPEAQRVLAILRRRTHRRRRAIAAVGSVLLHVLFVLALFPHPSKGFSGGGSGGTRVGAGTGEAYIAVDLYAVPPMPTAVPTLKTPTDPTYDALDKPDETLKQPPDALETTTDSVQQLAGQESAPFPPPADATSSSQPAAAAVGGAGQSGTTSGSGDDLWSAIAPCWKRIAGQDTLSVTLKITFAANGGLSKPPVIVRDDKAPITPQSLRSEALAMAALAQCGAYPMAANKQAVEVNFPRPE